jgi:hypothetical protein
MTSLCYGTHAVTVTPEDAGETQIHLLCKPPVAQSNCHWGCTAQQTPEDSLLQTNTHTTAKATARLPAPNRHKPELAVGFLCGLLLLLLLLWH